MYRRCWLGIQFVIVVGLIFVLGGTEIVFAAEQNPWKIDVVCTNGALEILFLGWLPDEQVVAFVDGEPVGEYQTDSQGEGTYAFPAGAKNLTLQRANGDTIVAGYADCTQPRAGIVADVNPLWVNLPVGGQTTFTATAEDETGQPIMPQYLWIAELGSITADGHFTATTPGDFGISVTLVGEGFPFAYYLRTVVAPPLAEFAIAPAEIQVLPGQQFPLTITALDADGQPHEVQLEWDTQASGEMVPGNVFRAGELPGDYEVTARIPGTDYVAVVQVQIFPRVERITIRPDIDELVVGDIQEFGVLGVGTDGEVFDVPLQPNWSADLGVINDQGQYAATEPGLETITAIVDLNALLGTNPRGRGLATKLLISAQETLSVTLEAPTPVPEPTSTIDPTALAADQATAEAEINEEIEETPQPTAEGGFYNYYDDNCLSVLVAVFFLGLAALRAEKFSGLWLATVLLGLLLALGTVVLASLQF